MIEVVGLSRTQQNELLEGFHSRYWGRLPVNFPDVPVTDEGVADSFWYLSTGMFGLSGPIGSWQSLTFPRFALGLLAHTWAVNHTSPSLQELQHAHQWLVRELRKKRDEDPLRPGRDQLIRELEEKLPAFGRGGSALAMTSAVLRFLLPRPTPGRVALRWWARALKVPRGGANSRPRAIAIRLFHFFRPRQHHPLDTEAVTAEEARKAHRNEFLAASFLADLDAHYGRYRRLNRDQPPLLVLKVRGAEERALLDTLLTAYRTAFRDQGRRRTVTRPVVLVVSDDEASGLPPAAPIDELESLLDSWTLRLEGDVRERRLLRVTVRSREERP
ncbi:hypothetical protein [Streptomyces sp. NPDC054863]